MPTTDMAFLWAESVCSEGWDQKSGHKVSQLERVIRPEVILAWSKAHGPERNSDVKDRADQSQVSEMRVRKNPPWTAAALLPDCHLVILLSPPSSF